MFPFYFQECYKDENNKLVCPEDSDSNGVPDWQDAQSLEQDDIAGITLLYPNEKDIPSSWGAITGKVISSDGSGLFGIHIVAIRADDKTPVVGRLTEKNGWYLLYGVPEGSYYVYAESPYLAGRFFTAYVYDYWRYADKLDYVELYKNIRVDDYDQLTPDSDIFSSAQIVQVQPGSTTKDINFGKEEDDDDNNPCGCLIHQQNYTYALTKDFSFWIGFLLVLILLKIRLAFYERKKSQHIC